MNTVLSCEYSESSYIIFEFINIYLSIYDKKYRDYSNVQDFETSSHNNDLNDLRDNFARYLSCMIDIFEELNSYFVRYIKRMVFTLVGFNSCADFLTSSYWKFCIAIRTNDM